MSLSTPWRLWPALLLIGNCSSHDVSLGDDRPPVPIVDQPISDPEPIIDPQPIIDPEPEPAPSQRPPCEVADPNAFCISANEICRGSVQTRPGFECAAEQICCRQTVGGPPPGGTSGFEAPLAGVGGQ